MYNWKLENSSNVVPHLECIDSLIDWKIFAQAAWIAALKLKESLVRMDERKEKKKKRPWKREIINGEELKQM